MDKTNVLLMELLLLILVWPIDDAVTVCKLLTAKLEPELLFVAEMPPVGAATVCVLIVVATAAPDAVVDN